MQQLRCVSVFCAFFVFVVCFVVLAVCAFRVLFFVCMVFVFFALRTGACATHDNNNTIKNTKTVATRNTPE